VIAASFVYVLCNWKSARYSDTGQLLSLAVKIPDTPGPAAYRYHSSMTARGKQDAPAVSLKGRPKAPRGL